MIKHLIKHVVEYIYWVIYRFLIKEGNVLIIFKFDKKLYASGYIISGDGDVDHRTIEGLGKAAARKLRLLRNPHFYD